MFFEETLYETYSKSLEAIAATYINGDGRKQRVHSGYKLGGKMPKAKLRRSIREIVKNVMKSQK
jgi:hypothetical protein